MPQNIITAGNATSAFSQAAGDDGTFKIVVGPNGSQVDALAFSAAGVPNFAAGGLKLATAIATTSGTSHDFTGIPSWVKRITVMLSGVSTNGTSDIVIRVGAGSVLSSGYVGSVGLIRAGGTSNNYAFSTGFIAASEIGAAETYSGIVTLCLIGSNTWAESGSICTTTASRTNSSGGAIPVGGTLDRIRLTTANGTDTFDAGSVNILYEG